MVRPTRIDTGHRIAQENAQLIRERDSRMELPHQTNADTFVHVRMIIGMILGLSLARMVNGFTRFIQHPSRMQVDAVHIIWSVNVLIAIIYFWWFEFYLTLIPRWTFGLYGFIIVYAILYAALSNLLFPDQIQEYRGYGDYFMSRRQWFFGIFALISLFDIGDTLIKGTDYFRDLGWAYPLRQGIIFVLSLIAIATPKRSYHLAFAIFETCYLLWWILSFYDFLG